MPELPSAALSRCSEEPERNGKGTGTVRVTMSVEISAPPELVWPYLVEPEKTREWFSVARRSSGVGWTVSAESFEWTSEPGGVGSTFRWSETKEDSLLVLEFVTTEWNPPYVFAFRMTAGDLYKSYEGSWIIERTETGSRFTFYDHVEFRYGPFGKIIGSLGPRTARKTGRAILHNLRRLAEADARAANS